MDCSSVLLEFYELKRNSRLIEAAVLFIVRHRRTFLLYNKHFSECSVHADLIAGVYLCGGALAAYYCRDAEFAGYYYCMGEGRADVGYEGGDFREDANPADVGCRNNEDVALFDRCGIFNVF